MSVVFKYSKLLNTLDPSTYLMEVFDLSNDYLRVMEQVETFLLGLAYKVLGCRGIWKPM